MKHVVCEVLTLFKEFAAHHGMALELLAPIDEIRQVNTAKHEKLYSMTHIDVFENGKRSTPLSGFNKSPIYSLILLLHFPFSSYFSYYEGKEGFFHFILL